ncbi:glycosyl transferase [bacterium]|nr:glycosyl transferase [bacterium]
MKLLVLRFSALGDVALLRPAFEAILNAHPDLELVFCSRKPFLGLFADLPQITPHVFDPVRHRGLPGLFQLSQELSAHRTDAIVDAHGVLRTHILGLLFRLRGCPVYTIDKQRKERSAFLRHRGMGRPRLNHAVERYADVLVKAGQGASPLSPPIRQPGTFSSVLGFAPFASTREKTWPLEHTLVLIDALLKKGYALRLYGSPGELAQLQSRCAPHPQLSMSDPAQGLRAEWNTLGTLRGMISMDSANMHLAALRGVPTLSIWGATHPNAGFAPWGSGHRMMQISESELDCRPCSIFGNRKCHRGDWACLSRIAPSAVVEAVLELWPLDGVGSSPPLHPVNLKP